MAGIHWEKNLIIKKEQLMSQRNHSAIQNFRLSIFYCPKLQQ